MRTMFKNEKIKEVLFETNMTSRANDLLDRLPL